MPQWAGTGRGFLAVHFATPLIGMAVGEFGVWAYTLDGGSRWERGPLRTFNNMRAIWTHRQFRGRGLVATVVGDHGMILRVTN